MVASADFHPRAAQYSLNLRSAPDGVLVPGGDWLLTAAFARSGQDLVLHGIDGSSAIVPGYFAGDTPPPLITEAGARLEGELVELLAGPRAPLQFAEAELAQATDASGAIGKVLQVEGVVQVSRADGSQAQLVGNDSVFLRDVIQAAPGGSISIQFVDGTTFALSDGARMTLDELVFNPGGGGNVFSASVLQGTFVFMTGQIAPSGSMDVTTPVGTIGVRGTTVAGRLGIEGTESIFTLLADPDGHVGVVEITNAGGTRILDQARATTRVTSFFIQPSDVTIIDDSDVNQLFDSALDELRRRRGEAPTDDDTQQASADDPGGGDTADATEAEMDQAAAALGAFETAAGPAELVQLPMTFIAPPGAPIPDAFVVPTFTTLAAGGAIDLAPASFTDSSGASEDLQPADTRDEEEAAAPPPPPPSPFTVITGGAGNDSLDSGGASGPLKISGNAGDDAITGGALGDVLDGGDGDDVLDAGPGDDDVQGGAGNDLIVGGSGEGNDTLDGGTGTNDTVKYSSATQAITVNLATGEAFGDDQIGDDTLSNIENVIGGSGNDTITGNGVANVLEGGTGNDALVGLGGGDALIGGDGNDVMTGGAGNDLLQGGDGNDTAVFGGNLSDYTVTLKDGQLVLTDNRPSGDGSDTLEGIETVKFADQQVSAADLADPNDAPAEIQLSNLTVAENAAGAVIGAVTVIDPDVGDSHTFVVSDERFEVIDGQLALKAGESLDFETEPSVTLIVTATDSGGLSHAQSFTIAVTNENEAAAEIQLSNLTVAENAAGAVIGAVSVTDPDAGDAHTFAVSDARFAVVDGQLALKAGESLDFETEPSVTLQITATDSGGLSTSQSFTINVTNVNEAPVITSNGGETTASVEVPENDTAVTAVAAKDPDAGDAVSYSIVGGFDANLFSIDPETGKLSFVSAPDYESPNANGGEPDQAYEVLVRATDVDGKFDEQLVTVQVQNINEAPGEITDLDTDLNTISEGGEAGSPVGIIARATDPDADDSITYSLSDSAGGLFTISTDGAVTLAAGANLDFETTPSYQITVKATDSGSLFSEQTFTINITNANELGPVEDGDSNANTAVENAAIGTKVGLIGLATDPDVGDSVTYSLTDPSEQFAIDPTTGVVTVSSRLSTGTYSVTITATDGDLSRSEVFSIEVTAIGNLPPSEPDDADDGFNEVAENAENGSLVGITAQATDPNPSDIVTYSLVDDAGGRFAINAETGVVTVANGALLDFESTSSHQITVRATSNGGLFTDKTFDIFVTDVNEPPSVPVDEDTSDNTVAENIATGTYVGIMAFAVDPEGEDVVEYSLVGDAGGRFTIDAGTGEVTVKDGSLLNFEGATSHTITVRATSSEGLFKEQTFTIDVTNVNEAPGAITDLDDAGDRIAETVENGTLIGFVAQVLDPDAGDTVTYSLADSAGGRFTIDAKTGTVTVADATLLDYETAQSHQVTVKATDSGGLFSTHTFTIHVDDANELGQVGDVDGAPNTVAENVPIGTEVGITAFADDPDEDGSVIYSLADDADGRFAINPEGVVTVASPLAAGTYTIEVTATDNHNLSRSQTFTIEVTDANDPPVLIASELTVAKGGSDMLHEDELKAEDEDTPASQVVYTLVSAPTLGVLLLNGNPLAAGSTFTQQDIANGALRYINSGAENSDSFGVSISDGVNTLDNQTITVTVVLSGTVVDGDVVEGNPLIVGDTKYGRLDIVGGADESASEGVIIGNQAGGDGTVRVSGSGSTLSAGSADIEVGNEGIGKLWIEDGAFVSAHRVILGAIGQFSQGQLEVIGGELHTTGDDNAIVVGAQGSGSLLVSQGGRVTALQLVFGDEATSFGSGSIQDAGTEVVISNDDGVFADDPGQAGSVIVGNAGQGELGLFAGARLEIRSGEGDDTTNPMLVIGNEAGSKGKVSVEGPGTTIELSMSGPADPLDQHDLLNGPGIAVGVMGEGRLQLYSGATITLTGEEAFISVGVGNYENPADTTEHPLATLAVNNSKIELTDETGEDGGLIVGDFQGGNGKVIVSGANSLISIQSAGGASIGREGSGELLVLAGGKVTIESDGFNNLEIGETETGDGSVTVSGAGSTLATSGTDNTIQVGLEGAGSLEVSDGGLVTTLYLGIGRYGTGAVTIQDEGSKVVVSNGSGTFGGEDAGFAAAVNVGRNDGSSGSLLIKDGGALEISAGDTDKIEPTLFIARYAGSAGTVEVTGAGSSLTVSRASSAQSEAWDGPSIIVGGMGVGAMVVSDQASVKIEGYEAYLDIGLGNWQNGDDTSEYPLSTLEISGGASVEVIDLAGGTGGLWVGDWRGGNGKVTVAGAGSLLSIDSQGGAEIGALGDGELLVTNGGTIEIKSDSFNNLDIGNDGDAYGFVQVSGTGSTIITTGTDNTVQVGRYGEGHLEVKNGGLVSTLQLEVGRFGTGTVLIDGPGSKVIASNDGGLFSKYADYAGFVVVGNYGGGHGTLTVTGGGELEIRPGVNANTLEAGLSVAREAGSTGLVSVSGAGSAIILEGPDSTIQIGRGGDGTLNVTAGAQVTANFLQFGRDGGANGIGLISGPGSTVTIVDDGSLNVGRYGHGVLTIESGGVASGTYIHIGRQDGGDGQIVVTGSGSKLIASGSEGSTISVGRAGDGTLTISDGGLVQGGWINIGTYATSVGSVTVTGAGSKFIATDGNEMTVGRAGQGTLSITNEGAVEATFFNVGLEEGSVGTVLVTGPGSKLATAGLDNSIQVGRQGTGSLIIEDGALVKTLNLEVGREGSGSVVIDGENTRVIVSNDGGVNSEPYAYEAGWVRVSRNDGSSGSLSVTNGAHLEIRSGIGQHEDTYAAAIGIGRDAGSSGHVLVSGPGSLIHIAQEIVPPGDRQGYGPNANVMGNSTLTLENQGQLIVEGPYARVGVGTRDGADAYLEVRSGGKILVDNGAHSGGMSIGFSFTDQYGQYHSGNGSVVVTGGNSSIILSGTDNRLSVGTGGEGSLEIKEAGLVKALAVDIGYAGTGSIKVDGDGSALIVSNDTGKFEGDNADAGGSLSLGGDATLEVTNGGLVEVRTGGLNPNGVRPGLDVGGTSPSTGGKVWVHGQGSLIRISQTANAGNVFDNGNGPALTLAAGMALVQVENGGAIEVVGSGARVHVDNWIEGSEDTPTLKVLAGGTVLIDGQAGNAALLVETNYAGSSTAVVITGPDALLTVTGGGNENSFVHIGYGAGSGRVTVSDGGTLVAGISGDSDEIVDIHTKIDVHVFSNGVLDGGGGTIVGDVFLDKGSELLAGDETVAQLDINGNLAMFEATVKVDASGNGQSDRYDVSGQVDIWSGRFEFSFRGTYLPQEGDTLAFLTAGTLNFDPDQVALQVNGGAFASDAGESTFEVSKAGNQLLFHSNVDIGSEAIVGAWYRGSVNDDTFDGTDKDDEVYGRDGADTLTGGGGDDQIAGGAGDDQIAGGAGRDILEGGEGSDRFFYQLPTDGKFLETNQLVSTSGATGDIISNFDATIGSGDKIVFNLAEFGIPALNSDNVSVIAAEYDGTNGTGAAYGNKEEAFILDGAGHLIYDDNGANEGYTVIATVSLEGGSPPISAANLEAA